MSGETGNGPWFYRLQPYITDYPSGVLTVTRIDGRDDDGRIRYCCAIAWTEDAEALRPRIVFDEIVSSGVGDELDPDAIAASALTFATYDGERDDYSCEPADRWREWVDMHGEHVGILRYGEDVEGTGDSLAHLRIEVDLSSMTR